MAQVMCIPSFIELTSAYGTVVPQVQCDVVAALEYCVDTRLLAQAMNGELATQSTIVDGLDGKLLRYRESRSPRASHDCIFRSTRTVPCSTCSVHAHTDYFAAAESGIERSS
jgi:hypothetical protein